MATSFEIINSLRNEFIQEANNAPKLFKDLAKVEQYIAESYKTRSFIELIQNADDAESTIFGVHGFDSGFIVANNGRSFTVEDLEALCRSGSSNKYRGGSTIGYRGIGFKSVVNLSERIYAFSGEFAFYFDKVATKKLFPNIQDVPLIRIPHLYKPNTGDNLLKEVEVLKSRHNYTTLFVFWNINKRIAGEEISGFEKSSLLFLNNIRQVCFDLQNVNRTINLEKNVSNNQEIVKVKEADITNEWEVLHSKSDPKDIIAFKIMDDAIVPASFEESVIHSFTPTIEFSGAYFKINGDYSTDPSRKNIDMDEFSQRSFANAVSLVVDTIIDILEKKIIKKGFFSAFINITGREGSKFRALLFRAITAELSNKTLTDFNRNNNIAFTSIKLRPDWLNYEDYEKLCHSSIASLSKDLVALYPELPAFLEQIGVKRLFLDEILERVNTTEISKTGTAQICSKIINQYRYDLNKERIEQIKNLKLFPVKGKFLSVKEISSIDEVNKNFSDFVFNNVDKHDFRHFFSKLNISVESKVANDADKTEVISPVFLVTGKQPGDSSKSFFKAVPNIQKWRSAEKNAQEYLKSLDSVLSVADVSSANMGYDLEVFLKNGKKIFMEIKSVSSFFEPIKITNNEYSSAHNCGGSYYLAVVINEEPFQIRLIPDPIKTLSFQKQIERWSWFCDSYKENLLEIEDLLSFKSLGG